MKKSNEFIMTEKEIKSFIRDFGKGDIKVCES